MREGTRTLSYTLLSIVAGFAVGGIVLALTGYDPFRAFGVMANGVFSRSSYAAWTILYATPIVLTGLSVAFAFKTGLFNIGAEGQYIVGALVAALAGRYLPLPPVIHPMVCILLAGCGAAAWGALSGFLKARFGVHEVISTIMLNWIALDLNNFMVNLPGIKDGDFIKTQAILPSASIQFFPHEYIIQPAVREFRAANPFAGDVMGTPINPGFIVAVLAALLVAFVLKRTVLGYELKAVGMNQDCAEYGGIRVKRSVVASMGIAGALAGIAGSITVLGWTGCAAQLAGMEGNGFDGITVALIAANSPLGCVASGLFYAAVKYGGGKLQSAMRAPYEIITIMMGVVVFFIAMPYLFSSLGSRLAAWGPVKALRARRGRKEAAE